MALHYWFPKSKKYACATSARRSVVLDGTPDRATFDLARVTGQACLRCCAGVDKADAISAKHAARKGAA